MTNARATLLIVISACCFGAIAIFTVIATTAGNSLQTLLALRYAVAAIALAIIVRPNALRLPRGRALRLFIIGGGGQVLVTFCALSSLRYVPAATTSFLFYTFPAWVAVIAMLRHSERLNARKMLALLLALVGVALMIGNPLSGQLDARGVGLALGAAFTYAAYIPLINREQQGIAPAVASAWVCIASAVIYGVMGLLTGTLHMPTDVLHGWLVVLALALVCTVAAFILFLRGLAQLGPVRTAIISTVEPFFTAFAAALVLEQPLSAMTLVGGLLIAAAVAVLS